MKMTQEDQTASFVSVAKDWAYTNGFCIKSANNPVESVHAPFSLFPSSFPKECIDMVMKIQPLFNQLVDKISRDEKFIDEVMEELSKVDDFMCKLYDIFNKVRGKETQKITLGIHRSDYLMHKPSDSNDIAPKLLQVELNTIASSFSSLSTKAYQLHAFLAKVANQIDYQSLNFQNPYSGSFPNDSIDKIPEGLKEAFKLYSCENSVIVMVVQPNERNIFDQRFIEFKLRELGIPLVRKTLKEILSETEIKEGNKLWLQGKEVAVVYYRAGYTPTDYPSEGEWIARLRIEQSHAIKCPNINYHIVGAKKVQQILADPVILERFVTPTESSVLRQFFAGLYPMDDSDAGKAAYQMVMAKPDGYVLKPQREGGGNNIYGNDIPSFLAKLTLAQRNAYILMDLIETPPHENVLIKGGELVRANVISELGVYGIWLSDGEQGILNHQGGYLVRTKTVGTNEGGVATGYSVLDSIRVE